MQPKRNQTIRGMPPTEREPLRRESGTVRRKASKHKRMLNRNSEPYRISNPDHHDCVSVPDLEAVREEAERQTGERLRPVDRDDDDR